MHDGKQKTGLAGCHGIELGVIKEGHGGNYTLLRGLGKEQGQGCPRLVGRMDPPSRGIFAGVVGCKGFFSPGVYCGNSAVK